MNIDKKYQIVISSGNLNNDFLEAEIYTEGGIFICGIQFNGIETIVDVSDRRDTQKGTLDRVISLETLIEAINEARKELGCLNERIIIT